MIKKLGLRARLMWLVALAMLPVFVLFGVVATHTQKQAFQQAKQALLARAQLVATNQQRLVDRTRQILSDMASGPSIRNVGMGLCGRYLSNLRQDAGIFVDLGVIDLEGRLVCRGLDSPLGIMLGDRAYFRDALVRHEFTVGEYTLGRSQQRPVIHFARTVNGDDGVLNGVAFAALDMAAVRGVLQAGDWPAPLGGVVVDHRGVVMASQGAHWPAAGEPLPAPLLQMLARGEDLVQVSADPDDAVYAVAPIRSTNGRMSVVLRLPRSELTDQPLRTLGLQMGVLLLLTMAGLAAAYWAGRPALSAMEQERQRLELMVNNMTGGVIASDARGGFLMFNETARQMLPALAATRGVRQAVRTLKLLEPDRKTLIAMEDVPLVRALRGEIQLGREMWVRLPDQPDRLLRTSSRPMRDAQGQITGALVVFDDITEARSAERERDQALRSLQLSSHRLQEAQRLGEMGNWEYDYATRELWWSDQVYVIFGLSPQEFTPTFKGFVDRVHPEDREALAQSQDVARSGVNPPDLVHRIVRPDGQIRWVLERTELLRDAQGQLRGVGGITRDITQRTETFLELQKTRDRHQALFESSAMPMVVFDAQTRHLLEFNQAFLGHYGYTRDEALALRVDDLLAPAQQGNFDTQYDQIRGTGNLVSHWRHRRSNGSLMDVEVAATQVDFNGRVARFAVLNDITERQRTQDALTELARRLQLVASISLNVTSANSLKEALQEVAHGACLTLRASVARLEVQPESDGVATQVEVGDSEAGVSSAHELETPLISRHGQQIGVLTLTPASDMPFNEDERAMAVQLAQLAGAAVEKTRLIESIRALNVDLERKVQERTRELARSEAMYREQAEKAPQFIWSVDRAGRATYLNPVWYAMVGGSPTDWLGGRKWYEALHPDDLQDVTERWLQARSQCRPYAGMRRFRTKDGDYRTMSYSATPLLDDEGNFAGFTGIDTDVTELKKVEEALLRSNQEMESFSYSVSHDLRSPLRAINGFSRILQESLEAQGDVQALALIERICSSTERMGQLIDGLLTLSQISRLGLERKAVDLSLMARQIGRECAEAHPLRHVEFSVEDGLWCQGDPRLLHAVLQNLIGNAWKFTAKVEHAVIDVGQHHGRDGGHTYFVRDNGAGFDMSYADKLFGTFQRLHQGADFPGTGIGLATVRRIIERHGGRVWAQSSPGEGAVFHFTVR